MRSTTILLAGLVTITLCLAVSATFAGRLHPGSIRFLPFTFPRFGRTKSAPKVELTASKFVHQRDDRSISHSVVVNPPPEFIKNVISGSVTFVPKKALGDKSTAAALAPIIGTGSDPISGWIRVRRAIDLITDKPTTKTHATIRPLYALYDDDGDEMRAVLRNLAVLHRAVVVHDLVRIVEQRLAAVFRQFRYSVKFADLRQNHGHIEELAISRAYAAVMRPGEEDLADNAFRRSVKDAIFEEIGFDRQRHHTAEVFDSVAGRWETIRIPIEEIVGDAICDVEFQHVRNRDEQRPSLRVHPLDFEYEPSLFDTEIRQIGHKVLKFIEALRPTDTQFDSIYQVSKQQWHWSTSNLKSLLKSIKNGGEDATTALEFINLSLESGLYREYDRLSDQSPQRQRLLSDLIIAQRALTVARARDESFSIFDAHATRSVQLNADSTRRFYHLGQLLIEYAVTAFVHGGVSQQRLQRLADADAWSLPVLRFDSRQEKWQAVSLPLESIVEFALNVALKYEAKGLVADRGAHGSIQFYYQSSKDAARDLVQSEFVEHFDNSLRTFMSLE